jgi:hypothetical protein
MTRAEVIAWLESRRPQPPAALRAHLAAAVVESDLPLPDHLALIGERTLAGVVRRPQGRRELALDLLAADAFVTYAFEAQAETDAGAGLAGLAQRVAARADEARGAAT